MSCNCLPLENFIEVSEGEEEFVDIESDESELKQGSSLAGVDQPKHMIQKEETNKLEESVVEELKEDDSRISTSEEEEKEEVKRPSTANEWDHIDEVHTVRAFE